MGTEGFAIWNYPDIIALCISSSGCSSASFIIFFNKSLNISVFLSSVNYDKLIEPEEGLVGITSMYLSQTEVVGITWVPTRNCYLK